ncbi:Vacuolar fusion protein CCZ1 [Schistosoma japonicum]|uniref:Vacuolar fusion protein CCZ1 n=4 Tax=Schistosoma japonicum TaxID=6182 RepID=A0A4Z2CM07_SCHJA|nr:Vacuolar fusion protein CCZ1 like [Schistosoma japonicum]TNN05246.1 Vacuolar fusion protein CCZ1 [Schistosoma japonicum]
MFVIERPKVLELFVYNRGLCDKEVDEFKKILYFFPNEKSLNDQLNSIGLSEAIVTFTNSFNSSCTSVCTKKTKRIFKSLTPSIQVVIVISLPSITNTVNDHPIENDCLHNGIIEAVLSIACDTFELFHGKVSEIVKTYDYEMLKGKLEHFFSRYLRTMLFEYCDILDCFNGIQFISIEPTDFGRVHGLLNRIGYSFNCIEHSAFFFEGRLVYSSLDPAYVRHIYHYLNSFLFIEQPDLTHTIAITTKSKHLGRYLVGPKDLSNLSQQFKCPLICSPGSKLPNCQLITYQSLRVVLCLLVRGTDPIPMGFFVEFDRMVGPRLTLLADRLASSNLCSFMDGSIFPLHLMECTADSNVHVLPTINNIAVNEEGISNAIEDLNYIDSPLSSIYSNRFIYWNPSTCSIMTTLHFYTGSGKRPIKGAKSILDTMVNLREEFSLRPYSWHDEITIRLDSHCWIVCRRSNGREVYMVFIIKPESLHKLEEAIRRVYETTFRGLFLLD